MQLDANEKLRYARQIALPQVCEAGQLKLKNSKVLCIGAGGLGTVLLQYLAASGVGKLGIIDEDVIELSNLQRQVIYFPQQVGMKKVVAAQGYLTKLNPAVEISIYDMQFTLENAAELVDEYDIVVDCTDVLVNRYLTNRFCYKQNKPFVFAGISQLQGQCMIFHGQGGPCFECLFPYSEQNASLPDCNAGGVLAVLPGMLGLMQAGLIMRYILQIDKGRVNELHTVDLQSFKFDQYQVLKNPECEMCVYDKFYHSLHLSLPTGISGVDLMRQLSTGVPITLMDVRSAEEHAVDNIGGVLMPLPELVARITELNPDVPVIVYCQTGKRSIAAAKLLLQHSFSSVMYLMGGLMSFQDRW